MFIGWFFLGGCDAGRKIPKNKVVAVIGSHQIRQDEFRWKMNSLKTACIDHFTQAYGAYGGTDFWEHSFQGTTPSDWLKKYTLQDLKKDYARLEVMQQHGVMAGYCFDSLDVWWKQRDDLEKERLAKGGVVYGTLNVNKAVFYTDLLSRSFAETKRRMANHLKISNDTLRSMYDRVKMDRYRKAATIKVRLMRKTGFGRPVSIQDIFFDPINRKSDELKWGAVYEMAAGLKKQGQVTGWFSDDENQDCKLECLDIRDNGFAPFEEVLPLLKLDYAEQVFNTGVDSVLNAWQDGHAAGTGLPNG